MSHHSQYHHGLISHMARESTKKIVLVKPLIPCK